MYISKPVDSPQNGPHKRLAEIVEKHIQHTYKKPIQDHNREAYQQFKHKIESQPKTELILDSCCGTGLSTRQIAISHPNHLVIGIDQSASRLTRECEFLDKEPSNILFLRANCEDFWRLCINDGIRFTKHYILYPNPYPKSEHLKRRWHGHPVFTALAQLSDDIELRSNWHTYLDEFKIAWQLLTGIEADLSKFKSTKPLTLFERKYADSGQALYKLTSSCPKPIL